MSLYKIYGNVGQGHKEGHVGKFSQFIHSSYIYFPLQSAIKIFQTVSLKISFKQKIIMKSMSQKGQGQYIMISLNCFVDILNGSLKFDFKNYILNN